MTDVTHASRRRSTSPRRWIAALLAAGLFPYCLFAPVFLGPATISMGIGKHMGLFLALAGPGLIIATPIAMWRWPRTSRPLTESVLIGAICGPFPMGYLISLAFASESPPDAIFALGLVLTSGALGGATFWAVATNFGEHEKAGGIAPAGSLCPSLKSFTR